MVDLGQWLSDLVLLPLVVDNVHLRVVRLCAHAGFDDLSSPPEYTMGK